MEYFQTGDFWGIYALPVPVRRWLIERKIKASQTPQGNDKPMTESEKMKFRRDSAQMQGTPAGSPKSKK